METDVEPTKPIDDAAVGFHDVEVDNVDKRKKFV